MEGKNNIDNRFYNNLNSIISDIYAISKEIEWNLEGGELFDKTNTKVIVKVANNHKGQSFKKVENYFSNQEIEDLQTNLLDDLEKYLIELEKAGNYLSKKNDEEKKEVLKYIKNFLSKKEKETGNKISQRFYDVILLELGLDAIDSVGIASKETENLLMSLMGKK